MKIAFIGKGGSGKTSISSSFIRWNLSQGRFTIAFDVDVNKHLGAALGRDVAGSELIPRVKEIFDHLEPERKDLLDSIGERPMIGCLPLAPSSQRISCSPSDPVLNKFGIIDQNLALLTTGTYSTSDVGKACYHGKLFGAQLIAHRIMDRVEDTIVFDVTAGTDPVATSLVMAYDMHVVVVEPTQKSVQVFKDYCVATEGVRRGPVVALANKVRSESDREYIGASIPQEFMIGEIPFSPALKRFEQGEAGSVDQFVAECDAVFGAIDLQLRSLGEADRKEYDLLLQKWFKAYSGKWYDRLYGRSLGDITAKGASA